MEATSSPAFGDQMDSTGGSWGARRRCATARVPCSAGSLRPPTSTSANAPSKRLQDENLALREELNKASMFEEIVGTSPRLRGVLENVSRVAPTESTVLITGETGTGKELVARAIHKRSNRSSRAFVSVNCAAIPPALIVSELFGHEKGAFTGALTRRIGRFELADGGTIFLDEIGDLPLDTQLALLRVLQEREVERLGSTRSIKVDVRVIAATNRDLKIAMASGELRTDLYYRLSVFPIEIPPLRERRRDIPLLVAYFANRYASKAGKTIRHLDKRMLDLVTSYPWPGNVRELQNVIERAVIVCETDTLVVDENWLSQEAQAPTRPLGIALLTHEREMIEAALAEARGKVGGSSGAAVKLGLPASTLESRIRALKIRKLPVPLKPIRFSCKRTRELSPEFMSTRVVGHRKEFQASRGSLSGA